MNASSRAALVYRALFWIVALGAASVLFYGLSTTNLLASDTWWPTGMARFARYSRIFALIYIALAIALRRYIGLCVAVPVALITIRGMGFIPFASVVLLWISCALLGRWLFRTRDWTLAFLGGLCVWSLAISITAHQTVHYPAVYLTIHGAILLVRRRDALVLFRDCAGVMRQPTKPSWDTVLGLGCFLYAFLAQWVLVWKPETGGDALAMHLAIALDFARNHAYTFDFHKYIWALAPVGADYCYAAAAVLGGEFAARLLNVVMFGSVAYLIFKSAHRWLSAGSAYLMAALFASAPLAQLVTGSMFVENFTAALSVGALCALWEFRETSAPRMLCLCAFLLGSDAGWKLGGLAIAVGLLPFIVTQVKRSWPAMARSRGVLACAALLFLVPAAFPYVKAYALTGNPVYPFNNRVFQSPLISETLYDYRYHQPLTWHTLYDITFYSGRYFEGQDGSFAYQYLLLVPLAALAFWKLRSFEANFEESSAIASGLIASVCIAVTEPNARYFYPALPLVMLGGAAALGLIRSMEQWLLRTCLAILTCAFALNIWFLPASNWYHREFYMRPFFAERGRLEYLRSSSPVREVVPFLNTTKGAVLFVQNSDIAGVRTPTFSNHWHNWTFRRQIVMARSARQFYELARKAGIQHYVKQKNPSDEDVDASPVLFSFLNKCGESEYETATHVVLQIVTNCEDRLAVDADVSRLFGPGTYDDDDPRITYLGFWFPERRSFPQAHDRTVSYSNEKGAQIRIEFEGSAFVYGYTKAFNRGRAQVSIDGNPVDVLDSFGTEIQWQTTKRYVVPTPGRHVITIQVMNEKSGQSKDTFVDLDFFQVEP